MGGVWNAGLGLSFANFRSRSERTTTRFLWIPSGA
jgi:hypothetical protein